MDISLTFQSLMETYMGSSGSVCFLTNETNKQKKLSKSVLFAVEYNEDCVCGGHANLVSRTLHTKVLGVIYSCFYLVARVLSVIAMWLLTPVSILDITHWMKVHWDFSCRFICGVRKQIQGQLLGKVIPLFSSHKISDIIHVYSPNGKT